jgi:hypothetical protein
MRSTSGAINAATDSFIPFHLHLSSKCSSCKRLSDGARLIAADPGSDCASAVFFSAAEATGGFISSWIRAGHSCAAKNGFMIEVA